MSSAPLVLRTPGYLGVMCFFALLLSGASLGAALDPAVGWSWPAAAFVGVPVLWACWSLRLGLWVTKDEVVVRNFLRTRRLARHEVTAVTPVNYDGLWQWGIPSRLGLTSLEVTTPDGPVVAYGLITSPARARTAAMRLRCELALPPGAAASQAPAHRAE